MILVLTDAFDVHADEVIQHLHGMSVEVFRLNLDVESLQHTTCAYDGDVWSFTQNHQMMLHRDIKCVWMRRSFVEVSIENEELYDISFRIWRGEWNKTLLGLYVSLYQLPWLNRLPEMNRAENKYLQLQHAKAIGFEIPIYIASNQKHILKEFVMKHDPVVLKMQHQDFYKNSNDEIVGIYVNKISLSDLDDFGFIEENPIFLQKYIDKLFEVRYTVVADTHFVCKIDSQKSIIANIDWRRYDFAHTPHEIVVPPQEIREKISQLMSILNLQYGALDFIVDRDNRWHFLEINPSGQWLWIENLTGLPISYTIATWLRNTEVGI